MVAEREAREVRGGAVLNKPLKIALDFDDTYTAMPEIWDAFIGACQSAGHAVTIVTARQERVASPSYNHDIRLVCDKHGIEVVYTFGDQKSVFFDADIVIDDCPCAWPSMDLIKSMATMDGWGK